MLPSNQGLPCCHTSQRSWHASTVYSSQLQDFSSGIPKESLEPESTSSVPNLACLTLLLGKCCKPSHSLGDDYIGSMGPWG